MLDKEREQLRKEINEVAEAHGGKRDSLLPILNFVQDKHGWISKEAMQEIAENLYIRPVEVLEVVSFYSFYSEKPRGKNIIRLCNTQSCDMAGKKEVAMQLEKNLGVKFGETTSDKLFTLEYTSCMGMCDQGPAMMINDVVYTKVTPDKIPGILEEVKAQKVKPEHNLDNIEKNIMKKGPILEATDIGEDGLKKAVADNRANVIDEMREAGIKGRGGAGFPVAIKWQLAAATKDETKYVVCNADEGEPGTFKDRLLLMDYANLVFEGMTVAGYAIGSEKGFLYLRGEYNFMTKFLNGVLEKRRAAGWLGNKVAGKDGFKFDIEIRVGAGAYVCGEETALLESLEGKRGEPRNRPPFPVQRGIDGSPTIINNVETFADAALIMAKGGAWFKEHGTEKSSGTKLLSISGDCKKPGIYEFPFGITVNELLKEAGGEGVKAVQVGGASGACIPAKEFDRKIGFEDIPTGGSVMVFGHNRDMLDVAENFLEFFAEESCGQCFACRKGTARLLEGSQMMQKGECSPEYFNTLKSLGETMQIASKCGLGQTASNAFLAIVDNFKDEVFDRAPNKGK